MRSINTCLSLLLVAAPAFSLAGDPQHWIEEAKLTAFDAAADDFYGYSVSIDGDTALVGAWGDWDWGVRTGAAYVYVRSGSDWVLQQKLLAFGTGQGDKFGEAVSLSGDTALIGAWGDDDNGAQAGAAYVFVRSGTNWIQQAKLTAFDGKELDFYGTTVAIDGDTALIAATQDNGGAAQAGSVYVYVRSGTSWNFQKKLKASDAVMLAHLGGSMAFEGDTAVIGATGQDNGGSAYVFQRSGTTWTEEAILEAGDTAAFWRFGSGTALFGDTAIVGATGAGVTGSRPGAAYVFTRSGSIWTEQAKILAGDGSAYDDFGASIALEGDLAVIAAPRDDDACPGDVFCDSGSLYVFSRTGSTWTEQAKLTASDAAAEDHLGSSTSLDGGTLLAGAFGDPHAGVDSGAAYVFVPAPDVPGTGYCFGDPGVGTPCPCSNDNDGSVPGSGCDNGVFSSGAQLTGSGFASVSNDSLVLRTTGLEPNNTGLYFQGNNATNGGDGSWFGDGLRCAGGGVVRIQIRFCDAAGVSYTTIPIGAKGGAAAGETKRYQCWYRNQSTPACGLGVNEFNLSNGYEVTWLP